MKKLFVIILFCLTTVLFADMYKVEYVSGRPAYNMGPGYALIEQGAEINDVTRVKINENDVLVLLNTKTKTSIRIENKNFIGKLLDLIKSFQVK